MIHSGYALISGIDRFEDALCRAQVSSLWERLTNRRRTLLPFAPIHSALRNPGGIYLGRQEIPLVRIRGSLALETEFDGDFRPLHKKQRQRGL